MGRQLKVTDFCKSAYGWDALELVFMIQSHSYDFGCNVCNDEIYRRLKDDRIQYIFDICEKLLKEQHNRKNAGDKVYYGVYRFYHSLSIKDCGDGYLYTRQIPGNFKKYHHFCCSPDMSHLFHEGIFAKTRLYRIKLKTDAKILCLSKAISTIVKKSYIHKLFNNGVLHEDYEVVVLGKDVLRIERMKDLKNFKGVNN